MTPTVEEVLRAGRSRTNWKSLKKKLHTMGIGPHDEFDADKLGGGIIPKLQKAPPPAEAQEKKEVE